MVSSSCAPEITSKDGTCSEADEEETRFSCLARDGRARRVGRKSITAAGVWYKELAQREALISATTQTDSSPAEDCDNVERVEELESIKTCSFFKCDRG